MDSTVPLILWKSSHSPKVPKTESLILAIRDDITAISFTVQVSDALYMAHKNANWQTARRAESSAVPNLIKLRK